MSFGVMSGVSQRMGVLDGVGLSKGKGNFGGEFPESHCNQWGLRCIIVRNCMNRSRCRLGW